MSSPRRPTRFVKPIRGLRWYIGGLFFLSTVINYIDRQTLSVLAPYLKVQYTWTNADFALIVISFRVAYAIGQTGAGQMLDRIGTRRGLSIGVGFYSVAAGYHRIELYAPGFEPVAFDINVMPGQVIPYRGSLYPVYY